jgi:DNA repair exonuclease SbcCD ATPase subunit
MAIEFRTNRRGAILASAALLSCLLLPVVARAQMNVAQGDGWSDFKAGYSMVKDLSKTPSSISKEKIESLLTKVNGSIKKLNDGIDKMSSKLTGPDKEFNDKLKSSLVSAVSAVRVAAAKVSDASTLDTLKQTMEECDKAFKAAYEQSKSRWTELKAELDKLREERNDAQTKLNELRKKFEALAQEDKKLDADREKVNELLKKENANADDLLAKYLAAKDNLSAAQRDGKVADVKRYSDELVDIGDKTGRMIDNKILIQTTAEQLEKDASAKKKAMQSVWKEATPYLTRCQKAWPAYCEMEDRHLLWDMEFPLKNYSYQSLQ